MKKLLLSMLAVSCVGTGSTLAQQRSAYGIPALGVQSSAQSTQNVAAPGTAADITAQTTANPQAAIGTSPIFLTISGVTASDISGQPLGPLQYVLLNPNGTVDLGVLQIG